MVKMTFSNKEICEHFFDDTKSKNIWKCKVCPNKNITKHSWTNLMHHINKYHKDYESIISTSKKLGLDLRTVYQGEKESSLFYWISLVVDKNVPFSSVNDATFREGSKYKCICDNTLLKYTKLVCEHVKSIITAKLPKKFGLVFDGWTHNKKHFLAVFID